LGGEKAAKDSARLARDDSPQIVKVERPI